MNSIFRAWKFFLLNGSVILLLIAVLSSCGNTRQLVYMQGKFDTARLSEIKPTEAVIQKGDLVSIIVYSDNPTATALYNQALVGGGSSVGNTNAGGGSGSTSGAVQGVGSPSSPGYLVDENGNIDFQGLGILHIQGMTKSQVKTYLDTKLKDTLLINPYYTIRFLNYKFTMLGEVNRPGVFNIPGERISLLEAFALAGDLTFYGRRDNVLILRDSSGTRKYGRLDLTKPEIMVSPYFYLQQGDIVYIEENRKKVVANDQVTTRNITIAATIISTLAIIYSIFKK